MKKNKRIRLIPTLFCMALFFIASPSISGNASTSWSESATAIEKALNHALSVYGEGKSEEATEMVADAYFGLFESEKANMEIAVRRFISFKVAAKIEKSFNKLRKAMHSKEAIKDIEGRTVALIEEVKKAAIKLDEKGVEMNQEYKR